MDFRAWQVLKDRGIGRYLLGLTEEMIKDERVELSLLISSYLPFSTLPNDLYKKLPVYTLENFKNYTIEENFDFFFKGCFFYGHGVFFPEDIYPSDVCEKCDDMVGLLYDLIPFIFPKNYIPTWKMKWEYISCFEAMKYASHLFTISEWTKIDGIKFLNKLDDYFTTIYGGVDKKTFDFLITDSKYDISKRNNNIIFISGADKRKNFHGAAKAFSQVYSQKQIPQDAKLYIICKTNDWMINEIQKSISTREVKLGEQIIVTDYIEEKEMIKLLSEARASIFPSFYEGLGLPILESYGACTPCFGSNLSSIKEFIHPQCLVNPYSEKDMEDLFVKIFENDDLCRRSVKFGENLLQNIAWNKAAKKIIDKLQNIIVRKQNQLDKQDEKIAVFGCLPPSKSGIALYNYKLYTLEPSKYDIFSGIQDMTDYACLIKNDKYKNIFPIPFYRFAQKKIKYMSKIFVIGGSEHHKEALEMAIKTKEEPHRWLYLHEAFIYWVFFPMFNFDLEKLKQFIIYWYPQTMSEIKMINNTNSLYYYLIKHNIYGILPLIHLTNIKNIFVNNEKALNLIKNELSVKDQNNLKIKVLFLPIELKNFSRVQNDRTIVGMFGIPHSLKMSLEVVQAIELLNKKNNNIKLIVAGYHVIPFTDWKQYPFVEVYDSPSEELLLALMNSVDCAIQLRPDSHGESSGCISQLLGMGKNILTSTGFISEKLSKYVHTVKGRPNILDLAHNIQNALNYPKEYSNKEVAEIYSFKNLSTLMAFECNKEVK